MLPDTSRATTDSSSSRCCGSSARSRSLASIYSIFVVDTAAAVASHEDRVQAEALVTAGLELTAHRITAVPQQRPSNGGFTFRLGSASVIVRFVSETARIDLNTAPKELLVGLFASLGAMREAESYADRIIGWRTSPADGQNDETAAYRTAGMHYAPRGGMFPHVGELWLVMGLPETMIERALPYVTVLQRAGAGQHPRCLPAGARRAARHVRRTGCTTCLPQRAAAPQNAQYMHVAARARRRPTHRRNRQRRFA